MLESKKEKIFKNDGNILFEFILEEYVKKTRGRYAEIGYYYWRMFSDNYMIASPNDFQEWFYENYDEQIGKIKSLSLLEKPDRKNNYKDAILWFRSK